MIRRKHRQLFRITDELVRYSEHGQIVPPEVLQAWLRQLRTALKAIREDREFLDILNGKIADAQKQAPELVEALENWEQFVDFLSIEQDQLRNAGLSDESAARIADALMSVRRSTLQELREPGYLELITDDELEVILAQLNSACRDADQLVHRFNRVREFKMWSHFVGGWAVMTTNSGLTGVGLLAGMPVALVAASSVVLGRSLAKRSDDFRG